jgi:predicted flap endonuclease-1-like 5' DNA nuclease
MKHMNDQTDDIRQFIQELLSRSATDNMRNLQRFGDMLRRASRGDVDQERIREEFLEFARDESDRYVRDLTRVGLNFYNTLLELNRHYNDRFFSQVFEEDYRYRDIPDAEPKRQRTVQMELRGPLGEEAVRSFVIENKQNEPVSVSFLVSEFTDEANTISFRPPLQLFPARFTLRPGEEHVVNLQVPLLKEFFVPGQRYSATVVVSGYDDLVLDLSVWADPPKPAADEADSDIPIRDVTKAPGRKEAVKAPTQPDDLKAIQGIGPTYEKKLHQAGIKTFHDLANADEEALAAALGPAAAQRAHREEWVAQARQALEGQ